MNGRIIGMALAAVSGMVVSCQIVGGFKDIHGGEVSAGGSGGKSSGGADASGGAGGGTAGSGGAIAQGSGGSPSCGTNGEKLDGLRGPRMVRIADAERCFWIDETEVTHGQYRAFLRTRPSRSSGVCEYDGQPSVDTACSGDAGLSDDERPVTCVDWCDASAFCEWAGKRLCEGDYLLSTGQADRGEWNFACSANGARVYPYDGTYSALACNGKDNPATGCGNSGSCSLWPAGSSTTCVTPEGIEDLAGNAAEWTAECNGVTGANDRCNTFGGDTDTANAGCGSKVSPARGYRNPRLGFRCCATNEPSRFEDAG